MQTVLQLTPSGVSDPYPHSTHSVGVLRLLVQGVQLAGVPREEFLRRAGIREGALEASEDRLAGTTCLHTSSWRSS